MPIVRPTTQVGSQLRASLPLTLQSIARDLYGRVRRDYYPHLSWSQTGEDMILRDLLARQSDGMYIDIGAFHPRFGSNTYALYKRGWRGVNVDARPGSMVAFRWQRPGDTNLELAVGSRPGMANLYVFNHDELSTLDPEWAKIQIDRGHVLKGQVTVEVVSLAALHERLGVAAEYELLTMDCEGRDADVLSSNDWDAYRPQIVVVECAEGDLDRAMESEPAAILRSVDYYPVASTRLSLVMRAR
jgi:FkbM family methyltransferase